MHPRTLVSLLCAILCICLCFETTWCATTTTPGNAGTGSLSISNASAALDNNTVTDKPTTKVSAVGSTTRQGSTRTTSVPASVAKNCILAPENDEVIFRVRELVNGGAKLIKYNLNLVDMDKEIPWINKSELYKPFFWVRTTGRHGNGLLLLRSDYSVYSLTTLDFGVETMDVSLTQTPPNCLYSFKPREVEELIRELVMNDFQNTSTGYISELGELESVCNMNVVNDTGRADFYYTCCGRHMDKNILCNRLEGDFWLNVLFFVITLLKVFIILYSPRFVPDAWYRLKFVAAPYIHKLRDKPYVMNIALTNSPDRYTNVKTCFKLSKFRNMPEFKVKLQKMLPDVVYSASIENVFMRIKAERLLPPDYAPVGLMKALYDTFVKCKIRERPCVHTCCYSDFCGPTSPCSKPIPWFRVLREIMYAIALIVLVLPWLARVYVYFVYEHDEYTGRRDAAESRGLRSPFPGNFTLYLTPLHLLFLIIYALLSIESCIYGVLKKKIKERFKFVLRKCFRDMRERDQMQVVGWAISLAFKPCSKYGIFGIGLGFVLWTLGFPFVFAIVAFYIFPTLNLTFRLMAHFCVYLCPRDVCSRNNVCCSRIGSYFRRIEKTFEMESLSNAESLEKDKVALATNQGRCQQLVVITLCLISMYSVIFLMTELISFFVEIFIYTLMGVILNASTTLRYVSLIIMLVVYAGDCFGVVPKKFIAFNGTMNNYILSLGMQKVEGVIYTAEDQQENYAFRVKMEQQDVIQKPVEFVKTLEGEPRWKMTRLLLFLSKKDIPLIPSKFFFDACKMPFFACPGELLISYLGALAQFGSILVFLIFVLIVVLAFGESYEVSATNQLLATVAGGFMPLILRKVLFKTQTVPTIDTSSINFQVVFDQLLNNFIQTWPVFDILIKEPMLIVDEEAEKDDVLDSQPGSADNEKPAHDEENKPFLEERLQPTPVLGKINQCVDLLVDIREVNLDDFPAMQPVRDFDIGSTSLMDDIETALEMEPQVDKRRQRLNNGADHEDV